MFKCQCPSRSLSAGVWMFKCQCPSAWTGSVCQSPLNPCGSRATGVRLCGTGFSCSRDPASTAGYRCNCRRRPGYAANSGGQGASGCGIHPMEVNEVSRNPFIAS